MVLVFVVVVFAFSFLVSLSQSFIRRKRRREQRRKDTRFCLFFRLSIVLVVTITECLVRIRRIEVGNDENLFIIFRLLNLTLSFYGNIMDNDSSEWMRRTLYAVTIGVSPMLFGLILIALARLILYRLELAYYRRQKSIARRASSLLWRTGRPTLSYTPVSTFELRRIIEGEQKRQSNTLTTMIMNREMNSSTTLTNLVIRREAIESTAITALFAPITSTVQTRNEHRSNLITLDERNSLTLQTNRSKIYDFYEKECHQSHFETRIPLTNDFRPKLTVGESFHSASSIPQSLNVLTDNDC